MISKLLEAYTKDDLLSDRGDVHSDVRLGAIVEAEDTAVLTEPVTAKVYCS